LRFNPDGWVDPENMVPESCQSPAAKFIGKSCILDLEFFEASIHSIVTVALSLRA
jgi:hypothetical protein